MFFLTFGGDDQALEHTVVLTGVSLNKANAYQ